MKPHFLSVREIIYVTLIGMFGVILWGLYLGQDLNPDLVNYHFYSGYLSFNQKRLITDIFPANIQGYLNPYVYSLSFFLYKIFPPIGVSIVLGALHGLCFISVYAVAKILLANWPEKTAQWMALACAIFGVINPFFLALVGGTFSDDLTPPLVLLPLSIIMLARFPNPIQFTWTSKQYYFALFFSGFLLGMAVGFKLVNCAFAFGILVAWFVYFRFTKKIIFGIVALGFGIGLGFLLVNGQWMWQLYREFHSPTFPFYNNIFKSQMVGPIYTNVPAIAAAHSFWDVMAYPFRWARGVPPISEWNFRDPRFAIIYVLLAILIIGRLLPFSFRQKIRQFPKTLFHLKNDEENPLYIRHRYGFIAIFSLISYFFWIDQFGALRYLIPVTLLSGILILIALLKIFPYRKMASILWMILAIYSLFLLERPPFERVSWRNPWYPVQLPEKLISSKNTLYMKEGQSFILPFFPKDAEFIGIEYLQFDDGLSKRAHEIIDHHQGPMRTVILLPRTEYSLNQLKKFGLRRDPRDCVNFMGGVYSFQSCRVEHLTSSSKPFVVPLPTTIPFDVLQQNWVDYVKGFEGLESNVGTWTNAKQAEIYLSGNLPKKFNLVLTVRSVIGDNATLPIKILIGSVEKELILNKGIKTDGSLTVSVPFHLRSTAENKIVIIIPKPISPKALDSNSQDERTLGIQVKSISIEPITHA